MYHFKNNFALEVSNMDQSIEFYQKALGLTMYSLNADQSECVLQNPVDNGQLVLSQCEGPVPFSITLYSEHITEGKALHDKLNFVKSAHPREARYSIADPDGNIIHIHAELEKVRIKASEKPKNLEEDILEGLDDMA